MTDASEPRIRSAVFAALLYVDDGSPLDAAIEMVADSRQLSKVEAEQVRALVVLHVSLEDEG